MCGGFNVNVLEDCINDAGIDTIDDDTRDASVERVPYRYETTVSDEEDPYQDDTTDSLEGDTYRDETTVSGERNRYQDETTVLHEEDTNRDEATVSDERDTFGDKKKVSDESTLNPKSESLYNETPKKKRLFCINIREYFSDSSETEDMSQYAPIPFPRKETTNDVTSSESSSDSDELEDVYGHIVFRRNERHKPNGKVDLLNIDPKSLPYRISNRVNKQSIFLTEDNIDKDILGENLERLRGILSKTRAAKLKKDKFSKHLVKEDGDGYSNEIFSTGKNECGIPNVQLKSCSIVLERLNISSDVVISHNRDSKEISNIERKLTKKQMALLKPCSIVLERLDVSTVVVTSHNGNSKEISRIERKRPKNQKA